MLDFAALLGLDAAAAELSARLAMPGVRLARITGPPGSGKSSLAWRVGEAWRDAGGRCVVATGDEASSMRELHPFAFGLQPLPQDWLQLAGAGTRAAIGAVETFVPDGGAGASVFDLLGSAFRQRSERALRAFSGDERAVLADLRRLARGRRRVLLIADNAHWWDPVSLTLITEILSDALRAALPRFERMTVLVVDTAADQPTSSPEEFGRLLTAAQGAVWHTTTPTRAVYTTLLTAMGLKERLPEPLVDEIYGITAGHLKLAEQVVAQANLEPRLSLSLDPNNFVGPLLAERVRSLGVGGPELQALLGQAAVLGLTFEQRDLQCLTGLEDPSEAIERAERIRFLRRDGSRLSFTHDVVRSVLLSEQPGDQVRALRRSLARCLRLLRPRDYAARADALLGAGDSEAGRDTFALACASQLRDGAAKARVVDQAIARFPGDAALSTFVAVIADGYQGVAAGDFAGCVPQLKNSSPEDSLVMAAERAYLSALCSIEDETVAGARQAAGLLSGWLPELVDEPELETRFLLLLQQAQVLEEDFDGARNTESRVGRRLAGRARFDPDARDAVQVQNRRSAAINVPEVAELRIRSATEYFRLPSAGRRGGTDIQRFRALNNLAAVLIRLGRDADAYTAAKEAEQVAIEAAEDVGRLDVLANNLVLAGLRSGMHGVDVAVLHQRQVIDSSEGAGDKFLHRCNLVAYLMLGSQDQEASHELDVLWRHLSDRELDESYLVYYVSALRVSEAMLAGDSSEAQRRHESLDSFVQKLSWPCASYVRRRHALLAGRLPHIDSRVAREEFDLALAGAAEIGPAWSYYARLVPCCELSFWSDS